LMWRAMETDHSWQVSAASYVELYYKAQVFHITDALQEAR